MNKQGSNGIVRFENGFAIKTLKPNLAKGERLQRFRVEVEALQLARMAGIPNVVEIVSAELTSDPPRYKMRRYAGDLDDLLSETRNDPLKIARLMAPAVKALLALSRLSTPIIHRDLKPANLLYEKTGTEAELVIADFGCAFIGDPFANRLTADTRAVGATFFRAPEYTHGRVEEVSSSADVFSVGKLLWYMCNGVEGEVFPYTLWFPKAYNLSERCDHPKVLPLNVLIANCVQHDPQSRISLEELLSDLENLMNAELPLNEGGENRLRLLAYEAELKITQEEEIAKFKNLLQLLQSDLHTIARQVETLYAGTSLASSVADLSKFDIPMDELSRIVVVLKSDMPIKTWDTTHFMLHVRALPAPADGALAESVRVRVSFKGLGGNRVFDIFPTRSGLRTFISDGSTVPYSFALLRTFIFEMLGKIA